jgi:hypothetical protein
MFLDFGRIFRRSARAIRNRIAFVQGTLQAVRVVLSGGLKGLTARLNKFATELQDTAKEINEQVDDLVFESDDRVLFLTIGQALSAWAKMEEVLVIILALLLRTQSEKAGLILYSTINFNAWISIIDELFAIDEIFSSRKPRWNKLAARMREIKDDRDRLAHHAVRDDEHNGHFSGTIGPGRFDIRRKSLKYSPMDHDHIIYFTKTVGKLAVDLLQLAGDMAAALPPSKDKFRE